MPLQVGALGETVTVDGESTLLNTQSTTLGTVIENKMVTELPLNGRKYLNLVALAPNVNMLSPAAGQAGARLGGERAAQSISAGGQRIFFNYYTLDGVSNTDPNFNNYIALPSIDAIQEFKVQTGVYPAEFGHQSTQVNVVTKSGGNAYHGSVFEFLRDEKFDAKPYAFTSSTRQDAIQVERLRLRGGRPRGPRQVVLHDQLREVAAPADHPVHVHRADREDVGGDFSEIPGTVIYDPTTGQPFPGNVIPAGRIESDLEELTVVYHAATLPGLQNNYVQDNSAPFDRNGYVVRADFNESPSVTVDGAIQLGRGTRSSQGLGLAGSKTITNTSSWAPRTPGRSPPGWSTTADRLHQVLQLHRHPLGVYQRCGLQYEDPEPEVRRPGHVGHSGRLVHPVQRHR